ncbi:MAG: hypothetical protein ACN4GM_08345 [Gammaproteobacteria bacterium]
MKIICNFHSFIFAAMLTLSANSFAEEQETINDGYADDAVSLCEKEAENSDNPDMYLQECIDRHLYPEISPQDSDLGTQQ